jgi:hypothetical protein
LNAAITSPEPFEQLFVFRTSHPSTTGFLSG